MQKYFYREMAEMNILKEIEVTRNRLINEINAEMDALAERAGKCRRGAEEQVTDVTFECRRPLSDNPAFFKGKKPVAVIFADNKRVEVHTWKKVVEAIMRDCISDRRRKDMLFSMCGRIAGNTRVILSTDDSSMGSPLKIDENLYIESHYDAETMLKILTQRILNNVGYDYTGISIALRK